VIAKRKQGEPSCVDEKGNKGNTRPGKVEAPFQVFQRPVGAGKEDVVCPDVGAGKDFVLLEGKKACTSKELVYTGRGVGVGDTETCTGETAGRR